MAAIDWSVRGIAAAGGAVKATFEGTPAEFGMSDRFSRWIDEHDWPARPLRIGVVAPSQWPEAWADRLHGAASTGIEWFALPTGSDAECVREHLLDAMVSMNERGNLCVATPVREGFEAGWFNWGMERPLSYASVFPCRVDCEELEVELCEGDSPRLLAAVLEAAAWSGRSPARLTLQDRLKGRCIASPMRRTTTKVESWKPAVDHIERAMRCLVDQVGDAAAAKGLAKATATERAAARAASAWLATWTGPMPDSERRVGIEACADLAGDEPEIALRLAAAHLACGADGAGLDAIERADRMLRDRTLIPGFDQFAFVQAELATELQTPLAAGRVAAGACLIAATMPAQKFAFFMEDVLDELKHSPLLVGRDQDHRMLVQVFRTLERIRRSERFGLPAAA